MASAPPLNAIKHIANPPTDAQTLKLFRPTDDVSAEIERRINAHSLTKSLRADKAFTESRPFLKIPDEYRAHSLTGGTLAGPGRVVVPPYFWNETGGKSLVSIMYLGSDLCGHPTVIHGGLLATIMDEWLARCCFPALPNQLAMTANLSISYKKPAPASSFVVLRAKTVKVEGRKAWVEGHIESLPDDGQEPVVYAEASALYIEPRMAAVSWVQCCEY